MALSNWDTPAVQWEPMGVAGIGDPTSPKPSSRNIEDSGARVRNAPKDSSSRRSLNLAQLVPVAGGRWPVAGGRWSYEPDRTGQRFANVSDHESAALLHAT